eukprot:symbB.v1.2.021511.t1/scaffold1858.1/size98333/4
MLLSPDPPGSSQRSLPRRRDTSREVPKTREERSVSADSISDGIVQQCLQEMLPSQGRERERIRSASRDSRDSRPDPRRSLDRYSRDWHDTRNRRRESRGSRRSRSRHRSISDSRSSRNFQTSRHRARNRYQ